MFRFASPWSFMLLAAVPVIVGRWRRRRPFAPLILASIGQSSTAPISWAARLSALPEMVKLFAMVLMVVALARPQWGTRQMNVTTEGINIILAVDLSESMSALDFKRDGQIVDRLEAVRGVIRDFIGRREGDRIGMVVFGSEAYTQVPLTRDYTTLATVMEKVQIGAAGPQTAIGDAIGISIKRLEDIESKSNIVILLTDGESNTGALTPEAATLVASERGIRIYTIGVGSRGRAPFRIQHPFFGEQYVYQRVSMDEAALKQIAEKTEGRYFRAADTEGLEAIYRTIDALEKTEVKVKTHMDYRETYGYFLAPALVLLSIWVILAHTRFLRVP
ncbi:MAG: VWA domain-containing protein [Desulfobacterales bacterium]|nr:VWA domain-containing protein [Desulfobacterales bacterium]